MKRLVSQAASVRVAALVLALAGIVSARSASAAISVRATSAQTNGIAAASGTCTLGASVTAGDTIVVFGSWDGTAIAVSSVAMTGETFTASGAVATDATVNASAQLYYAKNAAGGQTVITVTWGSAITGGRLACVELLGLSTTAPLDQHAAKATGNGATMNSGAMTTTFANDIVLSYGVASGCSTADAAWTSLQRIGCEDSEYKIYAATGTYQAPFSGSGDWLVIADAFTDGVGGGGGSSGTRLGLLGVGK
jgi:hypothetical protein